MGHHLFNQFSINRNLEYFYSFTIKFNIEINNIQSHYFWADDIPGRKHVYFIFWLSIVKFSLIEVTLHYKPNSNVWACFSHDKMTSANHFVHLVLVGEICIICCINFICLNLRKVEHCS